MQVIHLSRDESEKKILNKECEDIQNSAIKNDMEYVYDILTSGFKGYINFTDEELEKELENQFAKQHKIVR